MRKSFGSAIVKKAISLAMALMLVFAVPATNVKAAQINDLQNAYEETYANMTDDEKELVGNLEAGLKNDVDGTQGPQKAIDDVSNVTKTNTENATEKSVNKSVDAAKEAKEVADKAEEALESAKSYEAKLTEAIENDANIAGNDVVYCIDYIPENKDKDVTDPYNNCADIKIKVDNEQVSFVEYTDEKAAAAKEAADKANAIANNVTTETNITEAREQLEAAREAANAAIADAEKAYDSAVLSLDQEILIYNSLIAAYYPKEEAEKLFKANSNGEIIHNSAVAEKLMSKADMDDAFTKNLDAQAKIIADAEKLVHDCDTFINTTARDAVKKVEAADKNFVKNILGVIEQCELALEGCDKLDPESEDYEKLQKQLLEARDVATQFFAYMKNESDQYIAQNPESIQKGYAEALSYFIGETQKNLTDFEPEDAEIKNKLTNFFQTIETGAQAIYTWYTQKDPVHPDDMCPQESVHYAIGTANKLIDNLVGDVNTQYDGIIGIADEKIDIAANDYTSAAEAYRLAKEAYDKANIIERFTTLKAKLDAAEADLIKAKANFDAAIKDKEIVEEAKKTLDEEVQKLTISGNSGNTNTSSATTNSTTSNTTSNTSTPSVTSITDDPTALAANPLTTIADEATALDAVPKTGDKLPASVPFACASLIAFIGAALINLKRRITR